MQRRLAQAFLIALASGLCTPAQADDGCVCRRPDGQTRLGQSACIRTPTGMQLAVCEKVLNNTSWKFTGQPCPDISLNMTPRQRQG
jgi:hypothetical protein